MTSKRSRHSESMTLLGADHLRSINGIGPAVETHLNDAGIRTFAQLAAMSPYEIADVVASIAGLSAKRIMELDWIGQARERAQALSVQNEESSGLTGGQRQEIFTVHLVLSENNDVHHTRVEHVRSGEKELWAGWQAERLTKFVAEQTSLRLKPVDQALIAATAAELEPMPLAPPGHASNLQLRDLAVLVAGTDIRRASFGYGETFDVCLALDLSETAISGARSFDYAAAVFAKKLDGGPRQAMAETTGTIVQADEATLHVPNLALPRGIYRLEATLTLTLAPEATGMRPEVNAWMEGGLLQIY
jgi:hypothetical protein